MAYVKGITWAEDEAAYWATQTFDIDAVKTSSGADTLGTSRVTLKWSRVVPAGMSEDLVMTSIWIAKTVGGGLYSTIPVSELAAIETDLDAFATSWSNHQDTQYTLTEYAWHQYTEDSPRDDTGRGQKAGPAVRTTIKAIQGQNVGTRLPDQVAETVTLRTVSRRHWGRCYIPGLNSSRLQVDYGTWTPGFVDQWVGYFETLHDALQADGYQMGVWSQLHPAFMTVKQLEADDVPDIQRRRRTKRTFYRKILS